VEPATDKVGPHTNKKSLAMIAVTEIVRMATKPATQTKAQLRSIDAPLGHGLVSVCLMYKIHSKITAINSD
jgi:hypothetical protein